jgi:endonuclease/exonuclease/phosphatase family metal-dependent hydrolase
VTVGGEHEIAWRVLIWNLKHGRSVPSAGRDLTDDFAAALGSWEWDLALLQEVPPWWPPRLAATLHADQRLVLTSRNLGLGVRRALAVRWPDAIKSNGGGANALLVRRDAGHIAEHRTRRLCLLPERRWMHGVRLMWGAAETSGERERTIWICNLHTAADPDQGRLAAGAALWWAGGAPVVLGGDFNVRSLSLPGYEHVAGHHVDHIYVHKLGTEPRSVATLERGELSDHAPVVVTVRPAERGDP